MKKIVKSRQTTAEGDVNLSCTLTCNSWINSYLYPSWQFFLYVFTDIVRFLFHSARYVEANFIRLERFKIKGWQNDKMSPGIRNLTCSLRSLFQFFDTSTNSCVRVVYKISVQRRVDQGGSRGSTVRVTSWIKIGQYLMEPGLWRYRRKRIGCIAFPGLAQTVMFFDWLIGKYETFSLVNSWCLRNKVKLTPMWLTVNYARSVFCRCYCPSSGSLILGAQIVHIYEVKGKLALFSTKDNVFLTPHPSYSFTINLFSVLEDISYIPGS